MKKIVFLFTFLFLITGQVISQKNFNVNFCESLQRKFEIKIELIQMNDTSFVYINEEKLGFVLLHTILNSNEFTAVFKSYRDLYECEEFYIKSFLLKKMRSLVGISFKRVEESLLENYFLNSHSSEWLIYEAGVYKNRSNNYLIGAIGVSILGSIITYNIGVNNSNNPHYTNKSSIDPVITGYLLTSLFSSGLIILSFDASYKSNKRLKESAYIKHLNK